MILTSTKQVKPRKPIHPFPARMAPDLALLHLGAISSGARVLDPMTGSGTVARQAVELGHEVLACDKDPLAVKMTKVWCHNYDGSKLENFASSLQKEIEAAPVNAELEWMDNCSETRAFVDYWFAQTQIKPLRKVAYALAAARKCPEMEFESDLASLALTRIVITKEMGASLARDTSHSRPHRVSTTNDYDVMMGFWKSFKWLTQAMCKGNHLPGKAEVLLGDARELSNIDNASIDLILTSPPYLNAIDYMRGHKFGLIWLGYTIPELRGVRVSSVGAERRPDHDQAEFNFADIITQMCSCRDSLPKRFHGILARYAEDLYRLTSECRRVLKRDGQAVFVIGNSTLHGCFIRNSDGLRKAGEMCGLRLAKWEERELPANRRYLPPPSGKAGQLDKRMRTEIVMTFHKEVQ